jgi:vacuolar-type H+-ATPase subunit H
MAPPADARASLEAELAPIFAWVDDVESRATARVDVAERRAAEVVRAAHADAEELLRRTDRGLAALRARSAEERRRQVSDELEQIHAEAVAEAARVREQAQTTIPALVERVMPGVRSGAG